MSIKNGLPKIRPVADLFLGTAIAILCGCASGQKPDEAGRPARMGCQGCVLLDVKFIESDEVDWMGLGIDRPQPDEPDPED